MPLVSLPLAQLRRLVGPDTGREELLGAIEELGCDLEDRAVVTSYRCGRCGSMTEALEHEDFNNRCAYCGSKDLSVAGSVEVIRINLLPVRPDMFDVAGLARAVKGYLSLEAGLPEYRLVRSGFSVSVKSGLEAVRPHIVCCVARGLAMDDETLKMLMKMQENLHWALGRDRRRASIGVYDLDKVVPDFQYRPVEPEGIRFTPLFGMPDANGEPEMRQATPKEILDKHAKGIGYKHLLERFDRYPLLCDSRGAALSMPPIINSEETRVTTATRDLFIDVTGPDHNAISRTLAVIACSLADLQARVETVDVLYPDGRKEATPDLAPGRMELSAATVRRVLGFDVADIAGCLERMRYGTEDRDGIATKTQGHAISVLVPAYRADVMHEHDIIEDIGIAYGYHRIRSRLVPTMTVSRALAVEELSETVRRLMAGLGFLETMTLMLTNEREHFQMLRLAVPQVTCLIENPASVEQTIVRSHLLSGLLSTLRENTTREMPQFLFEVGDCAEPVPAAETGVRTARRLAAAIAGPRAGFADARQVVDVVAREFDMVVKFSDSDHPCFISGRAAEVVSRKAGRDFRWGILGEVHPEVLEAWKIGQPVALLELGITGSKTASPLAAL